ncbi:MAG: PEP-CTERM sorting domain-containing protein [Rhodoferax sp.]
MKFYFSKSLSNPGASSPMKNSLKSKYIVAACLAMLAGLASADTFSNSHDSTIIYFGQPDTTSYGQVFTSTGGTLTDWSFYADSGSAGNLGLVIANWDGSKATGPALYQSSAFSYGGGAESMLFSGINHTFTAGSYIAYLTVAGFDGAASNMGIAGSNSDGGMPGGFRFLNSNAVDPLTLNQDWSSWSSSNMQYSANFVSSVPEPESLALMLAGLGIVGAFVRRKARSQA